MSEKVSPWLVCKNRNEARDGNYGITIVNGVAQARMNIGGGRDGQIVAGSHRVRQNQWNHFALSYDGETLSFLLNAQVSAEIRIGKARKPGTHDLAFGRREDNFGDGYPFRGVIDEIRIYKRALTVPQLRQRYHHPQNEQQPSWSASFRKDGTASETRPRIAWQDASLSLSLTSSGQTLKQQATGNSIALAITPTSGGVTGSPDHITVSAGERPVDFDSGTGWHRINLDGIQPEIASDLANDAIERIPFTLANPSDSEQVARLMFEKTRQGILQKIGTPITGISAILRDASGNPTGIPVQLSKNWHNDPAGGEYSSQWFHGLTQVRLPPQSELDLELVIAYGHWGGVPAASHAQLSLIGWANNQRWDQSALGSWGESICYDAPQVQANCTITDVRPLMVNSMRGEGHEQWGWTHNVGGGDFFRIFDATGKRLVHTAMNADYRRYGPCLTEVTYSGKTGRNTGLRHSITTSVARTDDVVRATYRLRLDVDQPEDVSRLVIFQHGADTYNYSHAADFALGNADGLLEEWQSQPGGNAYRGQPRPAAGEFPWVSLHNSRPTNGEEHEGAWANRGIVIREWDARLGGKLVGPLIAEYGTSPGQHESSTIDIVPPSGVTRLEAGDFVETIIESVVMPKRAADYYGPNQALRTALEKHPDSWQMIHREALGNRREVEVDIGTLEHRYPDLCISAERDRARFTLAGGIGHVPLTFTGLSRPGGYSLFIDGKALDQSVHGRDFWQCDYDTSTRTWSWTFTVPMSTGREHQIEFSRTP